MNTHFPLCPISFSPKPQFPHPLLSQLLTQVKTTGHGMGLVSQSLHLGTAGRGTLSFDPLGYHSDMSCSVKMSPIKSIHLTEAGPEDRDGQGHS